MEYKTISEMFLGTTNEFSSKVLYSYKKNAEWVGIKGSDVRSVVTILASGLRSIGVGAGDKAAIISTNSPRWAMSDYGIICNGSVTVTVYPTLLPAQIEYILNNSDTRAIFVENQEQLNKILKIRDKVNQLENIIVMDDSHESTDGSVQKFSDFLDKGQAYEMIISSH